uniref:Lectin-like protein BA14k n=1 Tax=Rhodopseudomonas palustris (strain DX-1) TaxID=652103 RepID=E6VHY1_RHOPX
MTAAKLICAVTIVSIASAAPALAGAKHRLHHHHPHHGYVAPADHPFLHPDFRFHLPSRAAYSHNFGPPVWPDRTYATYDGPLSALCGQGAAAYRGQDGRRYPCN